MTRQEIEDALFNEAIALRAFFAEPSPEKKRSWHEAREIVDRAIEGGTRES